VGVRWLGSSSFYPRWAKLAETAGFTCELARRGWPFAYNRIVPGRVVIFLPPGWRFERDPLGVPGRIVDGSPLPGDDELIALRALDAKSRVRMTVTESRADGESVLLDLSQITYYSHGPEPKTRNWAAFDATGRVIYRVVDGQDRQDRLLIRRETEGFLGRYRPRWQDPLAYWDDQI
jgi:hypothetical protein